MRGEDFPCLGRIALLWRKPSALEGLSHSEELSTGELRDEVESAAEELRKGERIDRKIGGELRGLQAACRQVLLPLAQALVVVRQSDAVGAVAYPVHCAQCCVVEVVLTQVIFQDNVGARDAGGFAEELRDVGGVVENVDEEANVERLIGEGELRAVERAARNLASWARNDFHTFDDEFGAALGEQAGDRAVSTTNIEDTASLGWNQRRQGIGNYARAPAEDEGTVTAGDPGERPGRGRGSHRIGNGRNLFNIL